MMGHLAHKAGTQLLPMVCTMEAEAATDRHLMALHREGKRPATIYQRGRVIVRLERSAGRRWLNCTRDDLHAFLDRPMAQESRAAEVSHLRQLYRWATDEGLLDVDPAARLRRPKVPRRMPRPISEDDLALAVATAPAHIRAMLVLAAFCGLRAGEIAGLRTDDLWWGSTPPMVVVTDGKGGEPGTVPMCSEAVALLTSCALPRRGWVFPRGDGQPGPTRPWSVSHKANRHLHDLGIEATLHQLRHRFGTEVLRASGGALRVAQEALRHRSITSTQIYTAVGNLEVAAACDGLPALSLTGARSLT
jgi:site-specific recombinase XerC